jgi:integrase
MALYRRSETWWASFTGPSGKRVQRSTGTQDKQAAQELHDKWKADAWRVAKLGEKPRRSWQEAVVRWSRETEHKATHTRDVAHLRQLGQYLRGKYLDEVGRDMVDRVTAERLKDGVSHATVNRMLAVLRAVLRRAALEWEWSDRVPRVRLLPEPKRRVRFLTRDEADKLLAQLPEHLAEMARFSLATGLRQANVMGLRWEQVDLERRHVVIHADQAKARKAIAVPLNAEAVLVLRRQVGKHDARVFTYQPSIKDGASLARKGKQRKPPCPIEQVNTKAWREALKRAGIKAFRWHDLRHTWASWHVQQGTPLHVLQELGAWESVEMVRRYAHLTSDHLREYADKLAQPRIVGSDVIATVSERQ